MDEYTIRMTVQVPEHIADWLVDLLVETATQNDIEVGGGIVYQEGGFDFEYTLSGDPHNTHSVGNRFLNLVDAINEFRQQE